MDGRLDEAIYQEVPPVNDFIQPFPGKVNQHPTDAWVMFDTDNIYLSCRHSDSSPPNQWTANEMRRDTIQLRNNDIIGALFDVFPRQT